MELADFAYIGAHSKRDARDLFARHVSSGKVRFFEAAGIDFVLGRREGPYLWDIAGEKRLIDCHCNGGVFNLGHRNPEIVETLVESLQELDISNHHLISEQRAALAARRSTSRSRWRGDTPAGPGDRPQRHSSHLRRRHQNAGAGSLARAGQGLRVQPGASRRA